MINKEGSRVLQNELTAQIEALVETFNSRLGNELTDAKRKQDATIAAMETEKADAKIEAAKQGPKNIKRNRKAANKAAPSVGKLNGVSVAAMKPTAPTAPTAPVTASGRSVDRQSGWRGIRACPFMALIAETETIKRFVKYLK